MNINQCIKQYIKEIIIMILLAVPSETCLDIKHIKTLFCCVFSILEELCINKRHEKFMRLNHVKI